MTVTRHRYPARKGGGARARPPAPDRIARVCRIPDACGPPPHCCDPGKFLTALVADITIVRITLTLSYTHARVIRREQWRAMTSTEARRRRRELGLTQADLANKCGVSQPRIAQIEGCGRARIPGWYEDCLLALAPGGSVSRSNTIAPSKPPCGLCSLPQIGSRGSSGLRRAMEHLRTAHGLTNEEIAEELGLKVSSLVVYRSIGLPAAARHRMARWLKRR